MAEAKTEPIATRHGYGDALVELGEAHEDVVALDADLAVSTQSMKFGKAFPERFFNVGTAEANMMSMACGLAATGKVPYASTFAVFAAGRAYDQVRLGIAHNELKVRIGASHGGVSLGEDGASHQMIEDIALMRAMPRMQVVVPADYNQAYRATIESYDKDEPMYMRFGRPSKPIVYEAIPETLGKTGVAVTAEERRIVGGLADAIRHVAAEQHPVPVFAVGMRDEFGVSGTGEACMEHFGLTPRGIADRVREALVLKPIVSHPPLHGPEWT